MCQSIATTLPYSRNPIPVTRQLTSQGRIDQTRRGLQCTNTLRHPLLQQKDLRFYDQPSISGRHFLLFNILYSEKMFYQT